MKQIKAVTFDVYNTLIKPKKTVGEIYAATAIGLYPIFSERNNLAAILDENFNYVYKYNSLKYPNFGYSIFRPQIFWHKIVSHVFERIGFHVNDKRIKKISDVLYSDFCKEKNWHVFPEVIEVLTWLKERGIKVGVVSNFDERLPTILGNLGLNGYIDCQICSGIIGMSKPNPTVFKVALKALNVNDPSKCIHVGDNLELDYKAAQNIGMRAFLINRSQVYISSTEKVKEIKSLLEIMNIN